VQPGPDQRVRQVADLFDSVADTYDAVDVPWFGPIADDLVAALDVRPGSGRSTSAADAGRCRADSSTPSARPTGRPSRTWPGMVRRTAADLADCPQVGTPAATARWPSASWCGRRPAEDR
jgi:hypothetical protein